MCRIAGIIDPIRYKDQLQSDVKLMINEMIKGGPDDNGEFSNGILSLGHCRLSIIDLSSHAAQPMHSHDQHFSISFNGEIYNYVEIKNELLSKGYQFKSNSDTEVILYAFQEWGIGSFAKFNGMFAFAIYDSIQQKVYLARDHAGIKPLYYHVNEEQLYFASEVKAFKKLSFEENDFWKVLFLSYGYIPEPYTSLKDVFELPKSSFLVYDLQTKKYSTEKYNSKDFFNSNSDYESSVRNILSDAVKRNMISDAPIGLFLSGGIDSSILTLLAKEFTSDLHTLSIYFNEQNYSERKFQDKIASIAGSDHHAYLIDKNEFDINVEAVLNAYDQPSNDGVNTWFISKYARKDGLKAVLSGLGADELFGGYPSFSRLRSLKKMRSINKLFPLRRVLFTKKFNRLEYLLLPPELSDYLILRGFFSISEIADILNMDRTEVVKVLLCYKPSGARELKTIRDVSLLEQEMYMQNQLLKDSDYMSMQHGLEIRVPFLDKEFLNLLKSIPDEIIFKTPGTKNLLINSFKNILPEEIYNRPKKGFQFPFNEWLKNNDLVRSSLSTDKNTLKHFHSFKNGEIHWSKVWALMQLSK